MFLAEYEQKGTLGGRAVSTAGLPSVHTASETVTARDVLYVLEDDPALRHSRLHRRLALGVGDEQR